MGNITSINELKNNLYIREVINQSINSNLILKERYAETIESVKKTDAKAVEIGMNKVTGFLEATQGSKIDIKQYANLDLAVETSLASQWLSNSNGLTIVNIVSMDISGIDDSGALDNTKNKFFDPSIVLSRLYGINALEADFDFDKQAIRYIPKDRKEEDVAELYNELNKAYETYDTSIVLVLEPKLKDIETKFKEASDLSLKYQNEHNKLVNEYNELLLKPEYEAGLVYYNEMKDVYEKAWNDYEMATKRAVQELNTSYTETDIEYENEWIKKASLALNEGNVIVTSMSDEPKDEPKESFRSITFEDMDKRTDEQIQGFTETVLEYMDTLYSLYVNHAKDSFSHYDGFFSSKYITSNYTNTLRECLDNEIAFSLWRLYLREIWINRILEPLKSIGLLLNKLVYDYGAKEQMENVLMECFRYNVNIEMLKDMVKNIVIMNGRSVKAFKDDVMNTCLEVMKFIGLASAFQANYMPKIKEVEENLNGKGELIECSNKIVKDFLYLFYNSKANALMSNYQDVAGQYLEYAILKEVHTTPLEKYKGYLYKSFSEAFNKLANEYQETFEAKLEAGKEIVKSITKNIEIAAMISSSNLVDVQMYGNNSFKFNVNQMNDAYVKLKIDFREELYRGETLDRDIKIDDKPVPWIDGGSNKKDEEKSSGDGNRSGNGSSTNNNDGNGNAPETSNDPKDNITDKKKGLSSGAIAGIVIAIVLVIGGIISAIVIIELKKRRLIVSGGSIEIKSPI